MTPTYAETPSFSSTVRLELRMAGRRYELAAVGPAELVLRQPTEFPPCDAEVVIDVDGHIYLWQVKLPNGAVPFDTAVQTESMSDLIRIA